MEKTGTKQNRLIRVLRQVGREAFIRGYRVGRDRAYTGEIQFYNVIALKSEFDNLVKAELNRGRHRVRKET
jgi:hypothetical protein